MSTARRTGHSQRRVSGAGETNGILPGKQAWEFNAYLLHNCTAQAAGAPKTPNRRAACDMRARAGGASCCRIASWAMSKPQIRSEVESKENGQPYGVHEMPVNDANRERDYVEAAEISD